MLDVFELTLKLLIQLHSLEMLAHIDRRASCSWWRFLMHIQGMKFPFHHIPKMLFWV